MASGVGCATAAHGAVHECAARPECCMCTALERAYHALVTEPCTSVPELSRRVRILQVLLDAGATLEVPTGFEYYRVILYVSLSPHAPSGLGL